MAMTLVAIGTFILGLVLGALGGVYYLRKKMMNMQMSDTDIASMARSMGMNLNQKQMAQLQRRMKNMPNPATAGLGQKKPGNTAPKKKK
ncbi:MAG: YneF family protein [Tumebacillaceae bacterium]